MGKFQSHSWRSLQAQTARPGMLLTARRVLISSEGLKDLCKQGWHFSSQHWVNPSCPIRPQLWVQSQTQNSSCSAHGRPLHPSCTLLSLVAVLALHLCHPQLPVHGHTALQQQQQQQSPQPAEQTARH